MREQVTRRTFLKGATAAGVLLPSVAFAQAKKPAPAKKPAAAPEPIPAGVKADPAVQRGGTLKYGILSAAAHFDVHQSGTVANIGPQSPMYDLLIRRHPKDGQTIVPDLAERWSITPDGKKYTFFLRK